MKPEEVKPVTVKLDDPKTENEDDPNPIEPYGFPLYSDKYNPKPLSKYNPSILNYATSHSHMHDFWLVDYGTSEHIFGNLQFFTTLHDCDPITIGLPNGDSLTVSMKGVVHVTPNITIHDVYYSHSFQVNLISVIELTASDTYSLDITNKHAFIFDKVMMRRAGQSDMIRGLYYLRQISSDNTPSFVGAISSATWHHRLGHASSSKMKFLFSNLHLNTDFTFVDLHCSVCHFSK